MKKIAYLLILTLFLVSCGNTKEVTENVTVNTNTGIVEKQTVTENTENIKTDTLQIEDDENIYDAVNTEVDSILNELETK